MKRIKRWLDSIIKLLELVLVLAIILCVVLQILYRYIFDGYLIWTEETARYLLPWTVFLGMAYCFGHSEHLIVDVLTYKLKGKKHQTILILGWITSLIFCIMMLIVSIQGIDTIATTNWATIPFLSYKYVYISLTAGLALSILYLIINLAEVFTGKKKEGEQTL